MSLRSFLSGLVSSSTAPPSSIPREASIEFLQTLVVGVGTARKAALATDGQRVAIATSLGVAVSRVPIQGAVRGFRETESWASSVAFSGDSRRIIAGTAEGRAIVWSADGREQIAVFYGRSVQTNDRAFARRRAL
ncbi:MAG: hypothetical protein MJE77_36345 [Proteobacteria bacterium]|nr:hypothetical protein [Pseudomonadota bacterium]